MTLFKRIQQTSPMQGETTGAAVSAGIASAGSLMEVLRHAKRQLHQPVVVQGHYLMELALIGLGVASLSFLLIWATVTDRVSVEVIVALIIMLLVAVLTVSHNLNSYTRLSALYNSARESVTKTTLASELLIEFLREFTLKNQELITQMAETQKMRVIEEVRQSVNACIASAADPDLRRHLEQLDELIARKIMEIPTGVAFPVPRLEMFDQALHHLREPDQPLTCPGCGARQARLSYIDSRKGIQYTCQQCAREFSLGITVMLEKHS